MNNIEEDYIKNIRLSQMESLIEECKELIKEGEQSFLSNPTQETDVIVRQLKMTLITLEIEHTILNGEGE